MKITKEELLKSLSLANSCTIEKSPIAQMTMFTFTGQELHCFNGSLFCSVPLPTDFTGLMGAKDLFDLIRTAPCEDIALTGATDRLNLQGKGLKGHLMFQSTGQDKPIDFEELIAQVPEKLMDIPEDLMEGLTFCKWAASDKDQMGVFSCIQITGKEIVAGDAFRFSLWEFSGIPEEIIIPSVAVPVIQSINPIKMGISEKYLWFVSDDDVLLGVLRSFGTFPNVRDLFKKVGKKAQEVVLPESIKEALETMRVFLASKESVDRFVILKAEGKKLTVTGRRDAGELVRTVILEEPSEFEFRINVEYLLDILKHSSTVKLSENKAMGLFSGEKFYHLVSLVCED